MPNIRYDLRSKVFWGPTKCVGLAVPSFRKPKICDLDVAISVQQDVLWLQVAVYDIVGMQRFKG